MDFNTSLRRAIKTGDVLLGQNKTVECIDSGKARMVVIAANCPAEFMQSLKAREGVFIHTFDGSSVALGKACGKPFMVSALAVLDPGESDILSLKRG
ncbi:MAG TPA: 50S ribosomal protein L30e [Methanoregulaceae archaeon]|nr:50S ribosomal protein L30e [Methanoregulaceae archaeon]